MLELSVTVPGTTYLPGRYLWCLARLDEQSGSAVTYRALCYENDASQPPPPPPPYMTAPGYITLAGQVDKVGVVTAPILPCVEFVPDYLAMSAELEIDLVAGDGEVRIVEDQSAPTDCAGATTFTGPIDVTSLPFENDHDGDGCPDWYELGADFTLGGGQDPFNPGDCDIDPAYDYDEDGCTNGDELQTAPGSEFGGGLRDPFNPWDLFDTNGDEYIDLPNDILGVITKWGLDEGDPGYDTAYDRGLPRPGALYPWDRYGPDSTIDLPNDIVAVQNQWTHDCR